MKRLLLSTSALRSAALLAAAALPVAPAFGQADVSAANTSGADQADESAQARAETTIVVSGTRIKQPNLEANVPITSVTPEQLTSTGQVAIGDVLNELPSLRSTFTQANSQRNNNGTTGLNLLDLRGLGTDRTLILQNGRRLPPAVIGTASPDINLVPTDLIERVDIVTGGTSAVYGSDAMAGVVNFVLKRNFEGLRLRGHAGISQRADAATVFASAVAGRNFADGRGNVTLAAEYARQDAYEPHQRRLLDQQGNFLPVDVDNPTDPGVVNNSDGVPDRMWYPDLHSATNAYGGMLTPNCNAATPAAFRAIRCLPGTNNARLYYFQEDGSLIEGSYGDRDFRPISNNINGGSGTDFRQRGENQLRPNLERINLNAMAHLELAPAFQPFAEFQYAHVTGSGGGPGPAFFQGGLFGTLRIDNPYLTDQARTFIRSVLGPTSTTFQLSRALLDLGQRDQQPDRDLYRGAIGVRGKFMEDWDYELSANYGQFNQTIVSNAVFNSQRMLYALDAVRDPATGNIVCRVTIDPAARVLNPNLAPALQKFVANDAAQCVPYNPFGRAASSAAARAYVSPPAVSRGKQTQLILNGYMSGDTSGWFSLPGGPVGFALGTEYRRETAFQKYDEVTELGGNFLNAVQEFDPPAFEVKEAFAELRLPLLADRPFVHELTLQAAGRVADYKGATGTVFAWNAGGTWAPVPDIRFRGAYSVAVRAPNLAELYTVQQTSSAPGFLDPCSFENIGAGSPNRLPNCRSQGIPVGFNRLLGSGVAPQVIVTGGNPNLKEEASKSLTLGLVLTPRFIPGLTLSLDYYDITIDDVISAPTAQAIANACYDAPDLDNQFCDLFARRPAGSVDPLTGLSNAFFIQTLQQITLNFAKFTAKGVDLEAAYRRSIPGFGTIGTRLLGTYVRERNNYIFPDDPGRPNQILLETGDPRWTFNWNVDLKTGPFTVGYQLRYVGKQLIINNAAENVFSVGGRLPENADFTDVPFYPALFYHNITLGLEVDERFTLQFGIDNLTDRLAPFGNLGTLEGPGIFDNVGRFFHVGAVARF